MYRRLLTLLFVGLLAGALQAQDPSFSQFYANKVYLNPGFVGSDPGLTLASNYRNQWSTVPGGFTTYAVSATIQEPWINSGFGFNAMMDVEGAGLLSSVNMGLTYAYIIPFSDKFNINVGVRGSYNEKFIDWSRLVFTDQLDEIYGIVSATNAAPITDRARFVDFDAGAVARWEMKLGSNAMDNNLGFSVSHLLAPEESLQEIGTRLPRRYTVHYGAMIPIVYFSKSIDKRVVYLSPNIKADFQGDIEVFTYGLYLVTSPLYIGAFYQNRNPGFDLDNTNSLIFTVGFESQLGASNRTVQIGYSYDTNITGLSTRTQGVHELSLRFNLQDASMYGYPQSKAARARKSGRRRARYGRGRRGSKCYRFGGRTAVGIF